MSTPLLNVALPVLFADRLVRDRQVGVMRAEPGLEGRGGGGQGRERRVEVAAGAGDVAEADLRQRDVAVIRAGRGREDRQRPRIGVGGGLDRTLGEVTVADVVPLAGDVGVPGPGLAGDRRASPDAVRSGDCRQAQALSRLSPPSASQRLNTTEGRCSPMAARISSSVPSSVRPKRCCNRSG